jgi:DNA-binding HxlR family transcriptional regulator
MKNKKKGPTKKTVVPPPPAQRVSLSKSERNRKLLEAMEDLKHDTRKGMTQLSISNYVNGHQSKALIELGLIEREVPDKPTTKYKYSWDQLVTPDEALAETVQTVATRIQNEQQNRDKPADAEPDEPESIEAKTCEANGQFGVMYLIPGGSILLKGTHQFVATVQNMLNVQS